MKISLIIQGDLGMRTGGYLYDRMLAQWLEMTGHEVDVFSIAEGPSHLHAKRDLSSWLCRSLISKKADVILEDGLCFTLLARVNDIMRKASSSPIVGIIHNLQTSLMMTKEERGALVPLEGAFLNSLDGAICSSMSTLSATRNLTGRRLEGVVAYPGKDHVVPSPSRLERFLDPCLEIIHIGNISPHKGLDVLLEALSSIPKPDYSLKIAGSIVDKGYYEQVKALIANLAIWERVGFLGLLDERPLQELMASSHLLAVPSRYEGYGIALTEGLGNGLPVIGTTNGGTQEFITDGREGFLVPPGDKAAVADRIQQLMDRELLCRMSENALFRYRTLPTWKECSERVVQFLEGIYSNPS